MAEERLQDFLDNDSWKPYAKYLKAGDTEYVTKYKDYGVQYAYAFDSGNKKEQKLGGNTDADDPNRDTGISSEGASGTTRNIAN